MKQRSRRLMLLVNIEVSTKLLLISIDQLGIELDFIKQGKYVYCRLNIKQQPYTLLHLHQNII